MAKLHASSALWDVVHSIHAYLIASLCHPVTPPVPVLPSSFTEGNLLYLSPVLFLVMHSCDSVYKGLAVFPGWAQVILMSESAM